MSDLLSFSRLLSARSSGTRMVPREPTGRIVGSSSSSGGASHVVREALEQRDGTLEGSPVPALEFRARALRIVIERSHIAFVTLVQVPRCASSQAKAKPALERAVG